MELSDIVTVVGTPEDPKTEDTDAMTLLDSSSSEMTDASIVVCGSVVIENSVLRSVRSANRVEGTIMVMTAPSATAVDVAVVSAVASTDSISAICMTAVPPYMTLTTVDTVSAVPTIVVVGSTTVITGTVVVGATVVTGINEVTVT